MSPLWDKSESTNTLPCFVNNWYSTRPPTSAPGRDSSERIVLVVTSSKNGIPTCRVTAPRNVPCESRIGAVNAIVSTPLSSVSCTATSAMSSRRVARTAINDAAAAIVAPDQGGLCRCHDRTLNVHDR